MRLIYCADPLHQRQPDPDYAAEMMAAQAVDARCDLINFEALTLDGDADRAVQRIAPADNPDQPMLALYRGWMLRPAQYAQLYAALLARGLRLINDPAAYRHTHYLPESYAVIAAHTPQTVWLPLNERAPELDMDRVMAALHPFGDAPLILKDYVKSRKHEWAEACYIPSASDRQMVERVVRRFLELQGPDLNEGLVFRAYTPFIPLAAHSRSGMPLTREYRLFWLDGVPLATTPYWEEGSYDAGAEPPVAQFSGVAAQVRSRFFTMDVAQRADTGEWLIVELGDGQVAGLPARLDVATFYRRLADRWPALAHSA